MALDLSRIESVSERSSAPDFASSVTDAISRIDTSRTQKPSQVIVVSERPERNNDTVNVSTVVITPDLPATQTDSTEATTSTGSATEAGTTAVLLMNDGNGQTSGAAVINITDNADGVGSTISIQMMDDSQPDGISTVTIDTENIQQSQIVYGNISKDAVTDAAKTLFLIIPNETSGAADDAFLFASVNSVDTITADSFSNSGFTTFSGRDTFQSYGGAVSLEIDGTQFIFWLNSNSDMNHTFTGAVSATAGVLDVDSSMSTVAGGFNAVTLVFRDGELERIDQGSDTFDSFDAYALSLITTSTPGNDVNEDIVREQNRFIVDRSSAFITDLFDRTYAVTSVMNQSGYDDSINRIDLTRRVNLEQVRSRV